MQGLRNGKENSYQPPKQLSASGEIVEGEFFFLVSTTSVHSVHDRASSCIYAAAMQTFSPPPDLEPTSPRRGLLRENLTHMLQIGQNP